MNYGNGGDFKSSGELFAIEYIKHKTAGKENIVLFDVGANLGHYTVEMAKLFSHRTTRIYSFEPSRAAYAKMLENVNGIKNITANNLGFSDAATTSILFKDTDLSALASLYQRRLDHFEIQMNKTETIELTTIDNYCTENNIEKIDFLKLDVEGHELKVLQGAAKMISRQKIDFIQFEFGGCNIDSRTFFQDFFYLLNKDFTIYRIVENGLFLIPAYRETYEVFTTINYLAERKNI